MMKRSLLAGVALVALCAPAGALVMVEDVVTETNTGLSLMQEIQSAFNTAKSVVNEGRMIANQGQQIYHAVQTVDAVMHGNFYAIRNLLPELAQLGLVNPWDGDVRDFQNLVLGATDAVSFGGNLAEQARQGRQAWQFYVPGGTDYRAVAINASAAGAAAQMAAGGRMMETAGSRSQHVRTLLEHAGDTQDVKDSMDVAGRLAGETAVATGRVEQGVGVLVQGQARQEMRQAQEQMAWRASTDQLGADARAALAVARSGRVEWQTGTGVRRIAFNAAPMDASPIISDGGSPETGGPSASGPGGTAVESYNGQETVALRTMTANFGAGTAQTSASMGVNPNVTAGVCMAESGCRAIGAHSSTPGETASGGWGFTDPTFRETARAAGLDPATVDKNDPNVQVVTAAQYLKQGAQALQRGGISNPTGLEAYGYHMLGPANALAVAQAPDDARMSSVLANLSPAALARNKLTNITVGQWRANVSGRMGGAANQPVLI